MFNLTEKLAGKLNKLFDKKYIKGNTLQTLFNVKDNEFLQ